MGALLKCSLGERGRGAAPGAWEKGSSEWVQAWCLWCHWLLSLKFVFGSDRGTLMRLLKMEKTSPMAGLGLSIIHLTFTCMLFASVICGKICESGSEIIKME